jgi:hypothetical protein
MFVNRAKSREIRVWGDTKHSVDAGVTSVGSILQFCTSDIQIAEDTMPEKWPGFEL